MYRIAVSDEYEVIETISEMSLDDAFGRITDLVTNKGVSVDRIELYEKIDIRVNITVELA